MSSVSCTSCSSGPSVLEQIKARQQEGLTRSSPSDVQNSAQSASPDGALLALFSNAAQALGITPNQFGSIQNQIGTALQDLSKGGQPLDQSKVEATIDQVLKANNVDATAFKQQIASLAQGAGRPGVGDTGQNSLASLVAQLPSGLLVDQAA
jgi:hypothetical protein